MGTLSDLKKALTPTITLELAFSAVRRDSGRAQSAPGPKETIYFAQIARELATDDNVISDLSFTEIWSLASPGKIYNERSFQDRIVQRIRLKIYDDDTQ